MKMLKLSVWPDGRPIWINMDRVTAIIEALDADGKVECTHVYASEEDSPWRVKETPEVIGKKANIFAY